MNVRYLPASLLQQRRGGGSDQRQKFRIVASLQGLVDHVLIPVEQGEFRHHVATQGRGIGGGKDEEDHMGALLVHEGEPNTGGGDAGDHIRLAEPLHPGGQQQQRDEGQPDGARDPAVMRFEFIMIGVVILHWTLVLTLAIYCGIVMLMKGPNYKADSYPMPDSDEPL